MAYLTPKLLLFVLHAVLGSVGFYLTLFYRQSLHLSLTAIGIAVAISAFGNLLAGPFWTIIIERYPSRHGQLLAVMMLTGTMSMVAVRLAVDLIDPQYWQLASFMSAACYGVFALPCCALADYAVLKILGSNSILYGSQAVYGYVSKALCFLLVGVLIDNTTSGFDSAFYLWALSAILFTTLCLATDVAPDDKSAQEVAESSVDSFQPLLKDNVYGNNYAYHPFEDQLSYISEEGSIHPTLDELERRQTSTSFAPTYRTFSSNPNSHMHRVLTGFDSLHHTSTAIIRDIHVKASFIIADMENQVPSLGLALSHIPAADVVMSGLFPLVNDDNEMPPMRVIFATKIIGLSFMMLLTGISFSLVNTVLPIYLREVINAPITWLAFLRPTGLLTEVLTFWMSKRIIDKLGTTVAVSLGHIILMARPIIFYCFSQIFMRFKALAIATECLQGASYALLWAGTVNYIDVFLPVEQRSPMHGLLALLQIGFGNALGALMSGIFYDQFSASTLFLIATGCGAASMMSLFVSII
ncbi:hypothetical protein K450DRAFT_226136 [Umbelopsis ramanniana AG]|uniref:Major facilitator superfamily (MFS) profile domain-containing protein n=1 Tax=Umbelopsis ramanniana AG TaxID=1314678 RepID=A0AAD5EFP7_UMBRA|nr:uncharacterized protein K450DRAFT_226136 [Umbelopsis ramanniana AG]KAI8582624.1 hypothetical protein K450DRAFT_226136 [Umbelopsis ramanniana AG]